MNENNVPTGGAGFDAPAENPGKNEGKKAEFWEFTCRTCNGKFATNVYEPRFCLLCGANLHFK